MTNYIETFLDGTRIGDLQRHKRMAVLPLFGPIGDTLYLTLTEAFRDDLLNVTEVNESGSVPELRVENKADLPVLLLDGEELAGAKQNRVLNASVLLEKQSTTIIPVSCTEQGRWHYTSPAFTDSNYVMTTSLRASKNRGVAASLKKSKTYRSDQGAVWNSVEKLQMRAKMKSSTSAMRDVYRHLDERLKEYEQAFSIADGQTGMVVMIDGAVVGMDCLSRDDAFATVAPKLIRSYATDTVMRDTREEASVDPSTARQFLESLTGLKPESYKSVGIGEDVRYADNRVVGSTLIYRDQIIHGGFFTLEETDAKPDGRMSGARTRRRFRQ